MAGKWAVEPDMRGLPCAEARPVHRQAQLVWNIGLSRGLLPAGGEADRARRAGRVVGHDQPVIAVVEPAGEGGRGIARRVDAALGHVLVDDVEMPVPETALLEPVEHVVLAHQPPAQMGALDGRAGAVEGANVDGCVVIGVGATIGEPGVQADQQRAGAQLGLVAVVDDAAGRLEQPRRYRDLERRLNGGGRQFQRGVGMAVAVRIGIRQGHRLRLVVHRLVGQPELPAGCGRHRIGVAHDHQVGLAVQPCGRRAVQKITLYIDRERPGSDRSCKRRQCHLQLLRHVVLHLEADPADRRPGRIGQRLDRPGAARRGGR